jgi:release factor glutamine methyltransferase
MSVSSLFPSESVIVGRLRAAGCVFAEDEAQLLIAASPSPAELIAMVEQRAAGLPLEHVVGWAEFCGLRISVDPGVFVPRRRTEFLVRQAATLVVAAPTVVDLCCGSGALGLALAASLPHVDLHAVDIDPAAVRSARRNLLPMGGRVYQGDLYAPLPAALRGRVDVLLANAPYVPTEAIRLLPPEARIHEHRVALDGGPDGLDVLRRVIAEAPDWLAPGGHLLVETSIRQAPALSAVVAGTGLACRVVCSEEANVIVATRRSPDSASARAGGRCMPG